MSKKYWLSGLLVLTCGCSCMNNTEKGLLGGTAAGVGLGAAIGRGNPAAMAIGGITGAALGGMAGNAQDAREDRKHAHAAAAAMANERARNQMTINDIVQLSQRQTPDNIIVQQIDATGSIFNLANADIIYLQDQGVSPRVISAMQARRTRTVVVQPREVIYVPPPPPHPVYVEPGVSVGVRVR